MQVSEKFIGDIADTLAATGLAALSPYEVAKAIFLKSSQLQDSVVPDTRELFDILLARLLALRLLTRLPLTAGPQGYVLFGHSNATPQELACSLDPFAYVSHLSAMEYHGLTDRFPKVVFMSTPPASTWRQQARNRMRKDLGDKLEDYLDSGLPKLARPNLTKIGKTTLQFHERSQLGAFRHVSDSPLRVATIGRVFLDMIREPQLCGGIQHVIDVFTQEAKRHLRSILEEVNRNGKSIDKVRAGFLLSVICKLNDPLIDDWSKYAQRGGSRKLDPEGEYSPHYSQRWKLSLNVPSLTPVDVDEG